MKLILKTLFSIINEGKHKVITLCGIRLKFKNNALRKIIDCSILKKKELMFFDWVVHDKCNFSCEYCINNMSGEKTKKSIYDSQKDLKIAEQLVNISEICNELIVNFSGGEPLLSENIAEIIEILSTKKNIRINLITNLKLINKVKDKIKKLETILISLHIKYRSDEDVAKIIDFIIENKKVNPKNIYPEIKLSQVDYELNDEDRKKLLTITSKTGLPIEYQTYIPPTNVITNITKAEDDNIIVKDNPMENFVFTLGKRCSLGVIFYLLFPNAEVHYCLWCNEKFGEIENFLRPINELEHVFLTKDMMKCPSKYCKCNYNTFEYGAYLNTCKQMKYHKEEIMPKSNFSQKGEIKQLEAKKLTESRKTNNIS